MKVKWALFFSAGLWAWPGIRILRFWKWAWNYDAESGSINSGNDWSYTMSIGLAYLTGITTMLLLCWLLSRRQTAVLWTLWGLSCACVIRVIWVAPEEPIALFQFWSPLRFALTLAAMGMIGVTSYFDNRIGNQIEPTTPIPT